MSPSQEAFLGQARWQIAAMRVSVAFLRLCLVLRGYNPDQPRVRAGSPEGGQWTDDDSGDPASSPDDGRIILVSDEECRGYTVRLADEEARG